MLQGKERKKRKKGQICKVKQSYIKKTYIHSRLTARGKEQQEKQTKEYMQKKYNRLKKKKEEERKKGKLHRTTKAQSRGRGL